MPKADHFQYDLLVEALEHYEFAKRIKLHDTEDMKATARRSIALVRRSAQRVDDSELIALCERAERTLSKP